MATSTLSISSVTSGYATGTLTSGGTIPADGSSVVVGNKTYTFKTTLGTTEGNVLIEGSAANALVNLKAAINHSGTAFPSNTKYYCAAAHTQVQATTLTSASLVVVALAVGIPYAVSASSTPDSYMTWGATTLTYAVTIEGSVTQQTVASYAYPSQRVTIAQFPTGNAAWMRMMRLTDGALFCIRNGVNSVAVPLASWGQLAAALEPGLSWPPVFTTDALDAEVEYGGGNHVDFVVVVNSELTDLSYVWKESADGTTWGSALTTSGIYDVSVPGTLTITPTDATKDGYFYRCTVTNGSGSTNSRTVQMTVTTPA